MEPKTVLFLLGILAVQGIGQVIIQSDLQGESIVYGSGTTTSGPLTENTYNYGISHPGSKNIWGKSVPKDIAGAQLTVQEPFESCGQTMKLYVTADDAFKAYINGNFVTDGNDWSQTYSVDVTAYVKPCEKNYLRIWAQNTLTMTTSPAMISYRLEATSGCNNSPPPGVYYQDGQCKCANKCEGCVQNWTWSPAPDCQCTCKKGLCKFPQTWSWEKCACESIKFEEEVQTPSKYP